jgi:uncharacterized membrane protein
VIYFTYRSMLSMERNFDGVTVAVSALLLAFAAILAALIVFDRRGARHLPYPWLWGLPSILLIGLGILTGAARYPGLPNELPSHFNLHGDADAFVPTTPFNAFFPVIMQILVTAVLAGAVALMLRIPYAGEPAPDDNRRRRERAVALHAHALLILAANIDLALFLIAQPIWLGRTSLQLGEVIGIALSLAAGLAALAVATIAAGRQEPSSPWRGAFYADREDRRLFVPKRFGIGWTLNLGRPAGLGLLVALLCVPVLTAFLGHLAV